MKFEFVETNKAAICEKILRALPGWFGIESAILDYIKATEQMPMLIAKDESEVVGFLAINVHNQFTAEIHVMGVLQNFHRKNIGRRLIKEAEDFLYSKGYRFLTVKTLSPSRSNEEYDRTRQFYYGVGFLPLEEFKTLWGEQNPCLYMVKNLGTAV